MTAVLPSFSCISQNKPVLSSSGLSRFFGGLLNSLSYFVGWISRVPAVLSVCPQQIRICLSWHLLLFYFFFAANLRLLGFNFATTASFLFFHLENPNTVYQTHKVLVQRLICTLAEKKGNICTKRAFSFLHLFVVGTHRLDMLLIQAP